MNSLSNEINRIVDEIIECHNTLTNTLKSKEVEVSDSDTLSTLIDKVNYINVGKKWASGTGTVSSSTYTFNTVYHSITASNATISLRYVDIVLDFVPKVIVITGSNNSSYTGSTFRTYMSILSPNEPIYADANAKTIKMNTFDYDTLSATSYNLDGDSSYVSLGNGVYRIPVITSTIYNLRWIAYE